MLLSTLVNWTVNNILYDNWLSQVKDDILKFLRSKYNIFWVRVFGIFCVWIWQFYITYQVKQLLFSFSSLWGYSFSYGFEILLVTSWLVLWKCYFNIKQPFCSIISVNQMSHYQSISPLYLSRPTCKYLYHPVNPFTKFISYNS